MLCEVFATLPVEPTTQRLAAAGVPCGPVNNIDQVFADPHVEVRGIVQLIPRTDGTLVPTVAYPPRLSKTPAEYRSPPPRLGEDTAQVLEEELGLDADARARLVEARVIAGT